MTFGRAWCAAALAAAVLLTGCSDDGSPEEPAAGSATPTTASSGPSTAAEPPAAPRKRACYQLAYDAALAPTSDADPVPCGSPHTALTYHVGPLDAVVAGHLLAVDSQHVRDQVAATCPERFARFVGGSAEDRALSMLRPVWFTPTVEQADAGASWYRCDVVALAGNERLAPLTGRLAGALDRDASRGRYAMCGTAEPGTPRFERVICSAEHSWRAVATVPIEGERYPGVRAVRRAGEDPCRDAGAEAADDALDYEWGYEWPTAAQWAAGQHHGICWVPDS